MKKAIMLRGMCLILLSSAIARAATVEGRLLDMAGNPIAGMLLRLDGSGLSLKTVSGQDGSFRFAGLAAGTYSCLPEPLPGMQVVDPPCGFYVFSLDSDEELFLPFTFKTTGVSVDFGRPIGTKNKRAGTDRQLMIPVSLDGTFELSLFCSNLNLLQTNPPDLIVVEGQWYDSSANPIGIGAIQAETAGAYAPTFMDIDVFHSGSNNMRLELKMNSWPYFNVDGEVAKFTLSLPPAGETALLEGRHLCFCIDEISFFRGKQLLLLQSGSWCGRPKFRMSLRPPR